MRGTPERAAQIAHLSLLGDGDTIELTLAGKRAEIECATNLELAKHWLRQLNTLSYGQRPLFEHALRDNGVSLWTTQQFSLFEELKHLSRYQELITYLNSSRTEAVHLAQSSAALERCLSSVGLTVQAPAKRRTGSIVKTIAQWYHRMWLRYFLFKCRCAKPAVMLYTPEITGWNRRCDFRFAKVYELLSERKIPYAECFHTFRLLPGLLSRLRYSKTCFSIEALERRGELADGPGDKEALFDASKLDDILALWASRNLASFITRATQAARLVDRLKLVLKASGIKLLLAMDDFRASAELLIASAELGIPAVLVQHGFISAWHAGWVCPGMPPERCIRVKSFLLQAPVWHAVLREHAPHLAGTAQIVSGWVNFESTEMRRPLRVFNSKSEQVTVLLLFETLWPTLKEIRLFLSKLRDPRVRLWFKVRPDAPARQQVERYFGGLGFEPDLVVPDLSKQTIAQADFVLGSHSSVLYQLASTGLPVVRAQTNVAYGRALVDYGLALTWERDESLNQLLHKLERYTELGLEQALKTARGSEAYPPYRDVLLGHLSAAVGS